MSTLKVNKIEHTSTTAGGVSLDSSGNVTLPANTKVGTQNLPSAGPLSNRNLIINGAMNIWQRGTSSTGLGGGSAYLADRWMFEALGGTAARVTYDRVEDSPTISDDVNYSPYSARITITTTGGTASGDFGLLRQMIEGYNFQHIYQRPFTVSFWVKSSITGTFAFSAYGGAVTTGTPSFTQTYTIDTADTWEYKTISVPACPAGTLSNWSFTSGRGLDVMWRLWDNASSHSGTLGEWNTNTYSVPDASYTNLAGTNGATWQITQVQIEPGSVATPFEHRSYGDELARCERYYQVFTNGVNDRAIGTGCFYTTTLIVCALPFRTTMRANPTIDATNGGSPSPFTFYIHGIGHNTATVTAGGGTTPYVAGIRPSSAVSGTQGSAGEFKTSNAAAHLAFSAEL